MPLKVVLKSGKRVCRNFKIYVLLWAFGIGGSVAGVVVFINVGLIDVIIILAVSVLLLRGVRRSLNKDREKNKSRNSSSS